MITSKQIRRLAAIAAVLLSILIITAFSMKLRVSDSPVVVPTLMVLPTTTPNLASSQTDHQSGTTQIAFVSETNASPLSQTEDLADNVQSTSAPSSIENVVMVPTQPPTPLSSPTPFPTLPIASPPTVQVAPPPQPQAIVPRQVVVSFAPQTSAQERQAYIESVGGTVVQNLTALDAVVVQVPDTVQQNGLPASAAVVSAESDYYVSAQFTTPTTDPFYGQQWALPVIGAPEAWNTLSLETLHVIVAVIDSGICANHPDLQGRILPGYDFIERDTTPQDEMGHGCAVSGIIAANTDNGLGIAGVAPNALILPLRVLDANGLGTYSDLAAAIVFAADNGAQVINLSLGGTSPSQMLENAVQYAIDHGVTLIAAAGNTGSEQVLYPAAYPSVISVGALDTTLLAASFSAHGNGVETWAPGVAIETTALDDGYRSVAGTSFAVPHVVGMWALTRNIILVTPTALPTLPPAEPAEPQPQDDGEGVIPTDLTHLGQDIPDDATLINGDILVSRDELAMLAQGVGTTGSLWPSGIIPYVFEASVTPAQQTIALTAMQWWEDAVNGAAGRTVIDFRPRASEAGYLTIRTGTDGNYSYVGYGVGARLVSIQQWYTGVVAHEFGHALGLWHEQSRSDRDTYIQVNYANIVSGFADQFDILPSYAATLLGPYDLDSIMHYSPYAFSICPSVGTGCPQALTTIDVRAPYAPHTIGQINGLSVGDRNAILVLYGGSIPSPVSNDLFANAQYLATLPYTVTQNPVNSTVTGTDPSLTCMGTNSRNWANTVWFRYPAPLTQSVTVTTAGSSYDTVLGVFTGAENALTTIACNDDISGGITSSVTFNASPGVVYYIMVGKYGTFPGGAPLSLTLNVTGTTPASPDTIAIVNPSTAQISAINTLQEPPPAGNFLTYNMNAPVAIQQFVMGDWDGDGQKTPGVWPGNGAFWFTNSMNAGAAWTGIWVGAFPQVSLVAGRFGTGINHDCVGVVQLDYQPVNVGFPLHYRCDLSTTVGTLLGQWMGIVLQGTEAYQFMAGDYDHDSYDSIAARRGTLITWSNVTPGGGAVTVATFPLAQYIGAPRAGTSYAVSGDWDNDGTDSFGLYYTDGVWMRRNDLMWNTGMYLQQTLGLPIGSPTIGASWRRVLSGVSFEPSEPTAEVTEIAESTAAVESTAYVTPSAEITAAIEATTEQSTPTAELTSDVSETATPSAIPSDTATPFPTLPPVEIATEDIGAPPMDTPTPFPTLPVAEPPEEVIVATPTDSQSFPTLPVEQPTATNTALSTAVPPDAAMDEDALLLKNGSGWSLSADDSQNGQGQGWHVDPDVSEAELLFNLPLEIASDSLTALSFYSRTIGTDGQTTVEILGSSGTWEPITVVAPSADWQIVTVDLSAYQGQTVLVRFHWLTGEETLMDPSAGRTWQIDQVMVQANG
ncbi:MAG: S8 family serine peptidase [Anaerolineae bacterium]